MTKRCLYWAVISIVLSLFLVACDTQGLYLYDQTNKNTGGVRADISVAKTKNSDYDKTKSSSSAVLPPARWLSQPNWENKRIVVRGQNMPFDFWVNKILEQTGANISFQDGMNRNVLLTMNYTGTVHGALDKLAAMSNYSYTVDGNRVNWQEFVIKTFDISFMPGASQYMMGGQAGGNTQQSNTGGTTTSGQTMTNQYSNLQGNVSVWNDLEKTIKTMLSKDGTVTVSQATTTITVRDHAENVRAIGDYLASMNKDFARQVSLQVQVLQITLNKAFSYGINWNLIQGNIAAVGGVGTSTNPPLTSLGNDVAQLGGIGATGVGYIKNGIIQALLSMLSQQGQLSVVTQPTVVTLNNQVAQIAITTQKSYLASVTSTLNQNFSQASLTPGTVTTGFTLYVLPKITGNQIYLQLTSELSTLDALTTFSSTPAGTPGGNQIQEPTVTSKSFNQRTMVPSGDTLVLSGFRQVINQSNNASIAGIDGLAGRGSQQNNTEIIVLLTPIILGNDP